MLRCFCWFLYFKAIFDLLLHFQVVDMLFALLEHFNWRKFTLIFEATESRPLQTKLKNRVAEKKTFEMIERHYVRPGNEKCVTETVHLRECDHHFLSELIHQTKDFTRSKCIFFFFFHLPIPLPQKRCPSLLLLSNLT